VSLANRLDESLGLRTEQRKPPRKDWTETKTHDFVTIFQASEWTADNAPKECGCRHKREKSSKQNFALYQVYIHRLNFSAESFLKRRLFLLDI